MQPTIPGPGYVSPTDVAKNLYDFCNAKLAVGHPVSDVLYWKTHDGRMHFAICGRSDHLFVSFGGFEDVWDNSHGRLDAALASALGVPRQISDSLLTRDGLSTRRSFPMDRGDYTKLLRKWIQRATREHEVDVHLMPDAHRRPDGLLAFSGRAKRMVASPGGRPVDTMPLHRSILALELPADDRAWAKREEDPPLFTAAPIGSRLSVMRELHAVPPTSIEYGFDLSLRDSAYAILDPWLVQARYEPPQATTAGAWPVTLWSEPVTVESPPSYRELIARQRNGEVDAANIPWIYTAGLPRPRGLHPEWEGLHRAIASLRRKREQRDLGAAWVSGFCNAFLDSSAVRLVICRPSATREVKAAMQAIGWRGTIIEYAASDPSWSRRIGAEIERHFEAVSFREPINPLDPYSAKPRTIGSAMTLPWRKADFGI